MRRRWSEAASRAASHSLALWPVLAIARVVQAGLMKHAVAFDFAQAYLPAGHAVLAGHSPYPAATAAALAPRTAFVYPPLTAYLAAPFTVLPVSVAESIATALAIACVVAILWVIEVRDWRCYAAVFLWAPTFSAIQTVNVNLLLALGLAVLWRLRHRPLAAGLVVGAMIALKPFLWPVVVWLLCTRRFRAAIASAVATSVLVLLPWAAIGFAGLRQYPHLMSLLSTVEGKDAYTVEALLRGVTSWRVAEALGVLVGLAVLGLMVRIGSGDERRSFALAIAVSLILTPIVWMDYFVLLLVVVGLLAKRFGPIWLLPLLFWVAPQVGNGATWQTAACLAIAAAAFVAALRRRPARLVELSAPTLAQLGADPAG
jgi:glycosyl transferase family 87